MTALARLQALAAGFRDRAGLELRDVRERLQDARQAHAAIAELGPLLHRLAGSGATFGFDDLSHRARNLQRRAEAGAGLSQAVIIAELAEAERALAQQPLPAADPELDAVRTAAEVHALAAPIDVLEPDAAVAAAIAETLGQFGYRVRLFAHASELDAALEHTRPEALVVAIDQPGDGQAGIEAVRTLQRQHRSDAALLCLSATDDFDARLAAARLGADAFLVKPLDPLRLVDRLESLRRQRKARLLRVLLLAPAGVAQAHADALAGSGFELSVQDNPARIFEALDRCRPDLLLVDVDAGDDDAARWMLRMIRMHEEWLALPIVLLASSAERSQELQANGGCADDMLVKPVPADQLAAVLRARGERARSIGELMQHDRLTGLLTHARIREQLLVEADRARRGGLPLVLAMIEIDQLRAINDEYGHGSGDQRIRALATLLRQRLRRVDSIGRHGGEALAVLLPDAAIDAAQALFDDIRVRFAALDFRRGTGAVCQATISVGIASTANWPGEAALLLNADQALYRARQDGCNRVCVA
jgi:diguanylate cyclase (GGDEF)-like protein